MSDTERLVRFRLLDEDFAFYTEISEEEMAKILTLVRKQLEDGGSLPKGTVPANKIAMLACLRMASEYLRLEKEFTAYRKIMRSRLSKMTDEIEDLFKEGA
ncbi:MAG: cell division protein ZapA [Deltaproteobacteria bacterium]|nr:MAG: cell division protein ZapA [Deltaproteobacteria bacterium]